MNHYLWYVRPDQVHKLPLKVQLLFNWIAHANSALNPCLYIFLNENFRKAFFATLNNFWQSGLLKNNCSDTNSNILRFLTAASRKTNAYTLPQSPTKGKSGQANLALSLMSLKDARSPPNNLTEMSLNNNTKETKDNALDDAVQV